MLLCMEILWFLCVCMRGGDELDSWRDGMSVLLVVWRLIFRMCFGVRAGDNVAVRRKRKMSIVCQNFLRIFLLFVFPFLENIFFSVDYILFSF